MPHRNNFSLPVTILLGDKTQTNTICERVLQSVSVDKLQESFSYALKMVSVDRVEEERTIVSTDHPLRHQPHYYFNAALILHTNGGKVKLPISMEAFVEECMKAGKRGVVPDFTNEALKDMQKVPLPQFQNNDLALSRYNEGIHFPNSPGGQSQNPVKDGHQSVSVFSRQWWANKLRIG